MNNKYMKRYQTSLVIREILIKTTTRYYFHPQERLNAGKDVEQLQFSYMARSIKNIQLLWKTGSFYKVKLTTTL